MNRMQQQVAEFHRELGHPIGTTPAFARCELRADLIREEAEETIVAIHSRDFVAAADGLCDLLYVTFGAAVEWGLDLQPIFDEVHRANLAKKGGTKREDGKTLKPEGWRPPDVAGQIELQRVGRHASLLATSRALRARLVEVEQEIADLEGARP